MWHTKLNTPVLTSDLFPRKQLMAQLENLESVSLILLSAPAGYGKSVLISQWIKEIESATAWVSIDETMNDTSVFLTYLSESLNKSSSVEKQLLKNFDKDYNFISWPSIVEMVVNSVNLLEEPTKLILDDYHLIHNQEIHHLIQTLIQEETRNLQVVIITRWDPPFKLWEQRLYNRIREFRMSKLRFDEDELSQFLAFHGNISLTNDEIKTVINRTEGWILAIRLILMAKSFETGGNKKDDIKELSNNLDQILSFVSDHLDPNFFKLMQLCALCDQFNAALIDSICGFAFQDSCKGEVLLAKLKELNFFIIPSKEHGGWYRFHHLVREVLIQRLKKSDPDSIIPLYNFISEWFSDKGLVNEAIHYAIQAKNYALACKHITEHRTSLMNKGQWWVMQRWLDKIPRQIRNVNIDIMLTELLICEETWNIEDFFSILETLKSIDIENSSEENLSLYLFHLGYFLTFVKPDPKKAIEVLEQSKAMFYDESYLFGARRELILACSRQMLGFTTLALHALEEIREKFDVTSILHSRAIHGKVLVNLLSGNFKSANNDSKKLLFLVQDSHILYTKGWGLYFRGNVAFQSYNKNQVLQFFKETIEFDGLFNYRIYFDALAGLVLISSLQKDRKATAFFLEKMRQMAVNLKDTSFQYYYKSVQARVYWHIGQGNKQLSWAITDWVKQHPSSYLFLIEVPELTKLRIVISHGSLPQVEKAISVLGEVEAILDNVNNHYQLIDIILLKAMGCFRLGENKRAAKCLEEALILADKKDMIRPILEATLVMPSLFSILENNTSYPVLARINFNFVTQKIPKMNLSDSHELSLREQELIRLIYKGFRNKEVADQLNISVLTVKTHLRNIYRKLDVSSRTSMINKVLEENIFFL